MSCQTCRCATTESILRRVLQFIFSVICFALVVTQSLSTGITDTLIYVAVVSVISIFGVLCIAAIKLSTDHTGPILAADIVLTGLWLGAWAWLVTSRWCFDLNECRILVVLFASSFVAFIEFAVDMISGFVDML